MSTPGLAQGCEYITLGGRSVKNVEPFSKKTFLDDPIAVVAELTKQLMVVVLTICQPILLIMSVTQEGFLTAGTGKVLHVPVFAHGCHHSLLNGSPVHYH